mgnify:FL=1
MVITKKKLLTVCKFAVVAILIGSTIVLTVTGLVVGAVFVAKMIAFYLGKEAALVFIMCLFASFACFMALLVSNPLE